jgi:hypothetical protein
MEAAIWSVYFYAISHSPFAAFFTYSPTIFPFLLSSCSVSLSGVEQVILVRLIDSLEQLFIASGIKRKGSVSIFVFIFTLF